MLGPHLKLSERRRPRRGTMPGGAGRGPWWGRWSGRRTGRWSWSCSSRCCSPGRSSCCSRTSGQSSGGSSRRLPPGQHWRRGLTYDGSPGDPRWTSRRRKVWMFAAGLEEREERLEEQIISTLPIIKGPARLHDLIFASILLSLATTGKVGPFPSQSVASPDWTRAGGGNGRGSNFAEIIETNEAKTFSLSAQPGPQVNYGSSTW